MRYAWWIGSLCIFGMGAGADPVSTTAENCDLRKTILPRVILIEEDHAAPTSLATRWQVARAAARGLYPAAIEPMGRLDGRRVTTTGTFLPVNERDVVHRLGGSPARSQLHALESPEAYAALFTYYFRIQQLTGGSSPVAAAMNIADFSKDLPLFARATSALARLGGPTSLSRVARAMTELGHDTDYQKLDDIEKVGEFRRRFEKTFSLNDFALFAGGHHDAVVRLINAEASRVHVTRPLPVLNTARDQVAFGCRAVPCEPTGRLRELLIDRRDRTFGTKVAQLLCAYAGRAPALVVDVGYAHGPGLIDYLRRTSQNRVRVTELRSDASATQDQIQKILRSLDRTAKADSA